MKTIQMNAKRLIALLLCVTAIASVCFLALPAQAENDGAKLYVCDWFCHLPPWTGEGDCAAELYAWDNEAEALIAAEDFKLLTLRGKTVDRDAYTIEDRDGRTVLTLKEEFLKTLEDGVYYPEAEFRLLVLPMKFSVTTTQKDGSDIRIEFPPYPGTGDATVWLRDDDTVFSWDAFLSLRLGDRELARDEDFTVGEWAGTVHLVLKEKFLDTLPYGEYRFTADFLNVKNVTLLLKIENPHRTGDVDGDGRVTSKDARLALRMAAQLDPGNGMRALAADIDRSGGTEAADARKILRAAAKLDVFRVEETLCIPDSADAAGYPYEYRIGGLNAAATQYQWVAATDPAEGLTVTEQTVDRSKDGEVGMACAQRFLISATAPGTYELHLKQKTSWEDGCIDEIVFVFEVEKG